MSTAQNVYDQLSKQFSGLSMDKIGDSYKISCNGQFTLYLPENFSNSTDVFSFYQGAGDSSGKGEARVAKAIEESVIRENSDKIICVTGCSDTTNLPTALNILSGGSGFINNYNMGWSAGAFSALNNTINYVKTNPNATPQTTVLLESAFNGSGLGNLTQSNLEALKNNGTTIVVVEDSNIPGYNNNSNLVDLAKYANVVIVENTKVFSSGEGHVQVPVDAFNENIIGLLSGDITKLNELQNHYNYKMYNPVTGQFEYVSADTGIKALTSNINANSNNLEFDEEYVKQAIKYAEQASINVETTPNTISEAINLASGVNVDLSDWINATVDANIQIKAVYEMSTILGEILNELSPLDNLLSDYVKQYGNNASMIPKYISDALATGKMTKDNISSFMGKMVENGIVTSANMKDIVPGMVVDGIIDASMLVNVASECQRLLAKQGVNSTGSTNFSSSGYYRNLKVTNNPVQNIQSDLIDLMLAKGTSAEEAQQFSNNFIDQYNSALGQKMVNENLMYSGDGVAQAAFASIGLFTSFGYMLNYANASFESNGKNGLMLGTNGNYVSGLDCNNSFDFLARCAGLNASGYNAANKEMYAVTIKEKILDGHDSKSYWHTKMVQDGRIAECLDSNGAFNSNFKNGNVGDIIVCENGAHMLTIVDKDANGYYVSEETSSTARGQGLRIHYYNYEDIPKLAGSSGYSGSTAYVVHMDNFYSNQSSISKEHGFVTYGYDASGNIIEITNDITYGDDSSLYGHFNNYIPPEVIAKGLGLSASTEELLKGEFNYRNNNANVKEYEVADSIMKKLEEIEMLKKYKNYNSTSSSSFEMEVPDTGRKVKTWMEASTITSVNSEQYKFLHSGSVYEDENGLCKYKDENGQEYYCVALGTYYCGGRVGEKFKIDLKNEDGSINSIFVITGDVKSDKHTDPNHQYTYGLSGEKGNNILEFIVGDSFRSIQKDGAAFTGDCSSIKGLSGEIEKIYYLGNNNPGFTNIPSSGGNYGGSGSFGWGGGSDNITIVPNNPNDSKDPNTPDDSKDPNTPDDSKDPNTPDDSKDSNTPDDSKDPNTPDDSKDPNTPDDSKDSNNTTNSWTSNISNSVKKPSNSFNPSHDDNILNKPTGDEDIGWDIPKQDDSNSSNEPIIEPIPISPNDSNNVDNDISNDINNNVNKSNNRSSTVGIALGAAAIAGAALAGKKIYDKYQDKDKDENVDEKYFEDYDMLESNYTVDKESNKDNDINNGNRDNSNLENSKPEINPYFS